MITALATSGGLADLWAQPFMRNAFVAGLPIAALAGLVGYFMVLRSQVFSGDALSHVAFTGALGALAFGIDPRIGLFVATVGVGLALGLLGLHGRADDVVIGTVFAWVLGLGVLALSVYATSGRSAADGAAGVRVLFGSIFGLDTAQAKVGAAVAMALIAFVLVLARPLLFASLSEAVAAARGVPVRALGVALLGLVGATAAEATQAVGALLLLGLLAAPAGAAQQLSARPYVAMGLSSGLSVAAMALGLVVSYVVPKVPPSFAIIAVASAFYGGALLLGRRRRSLGRSTPSPLVRAGVAGSA